MHRDFQPYLKPDGNGIDYSELVDYDTKYVLDNNLGRQHPLWERRIVNAMTKGDKAELLSAVASAIKFGLDKRNPDLVDKAKAQL